MIPCQICGKDSGAHWVTGYIAASDNQKMALCAQHDTPENRKGIHMAWQFAMMKSIESATRNAAYFAMRNTLRMLTIAFSGGGSLSVPCLECEVTEHSALKVTAPDGSLSFFPMQHIRRYDLRSMTAKDVDADDADRKQHQN